MFRQVVENTVHRLAANFMSAAGGLHMGGLGLHCACGFGGLRLHSAGGGGGNLGHAFGAAGLVLGWAGGNQGRDVQADHTHKRHRKQGQGDAAATQVFQA